MPLVSASNPPARRSPLRKADSLWTDGQTAPAARRASAPGLPFWGGERRLGPRFFPQGSSFCSLFVSFCDPAITAKRPERKTVPKGLAWEKVASLCWSFSIYFLYIYIYTHTHTHIYIYIYIKYIYIYIICLPVKFAFIDVLLMDHLGLYTPISVTTSILKTNLKDIYIYIYILRTVGCIQTIAYTCANLSWFKGKAKPV